MGQGKGHQARMAAMRGGGGAPPTPQAIAENLAKQLNMPPNKVKAAAYYKRIQMLKDKRSRDQALLMKGLLENAGPNGHGHGSLGMITLRMGLPHAKVTDFASVLGPMRDHGMVGAVYPNGYKAGDVQSSSQIEVQTIISKADVKKLSRISTDVIIAMLDISRNNG